MIDCILKIFLAALTTSFLAPASHVYCGLYTAKDSVIYGQYTIIYDVDLRIIRNRVDFIES